MEWFYEGISAKEIASRLQRDVSGIRKVINQNKALPLMATPPPPKKRSGRLSVATNREVERLGRCLQRFPFKTARQRKAEV
jgi:transposase